MSVLRKVQPVLSDEAVPKAGRLLMRAERVIHSLGEDGVKPLSPTEVKKLKDDLGYGTPEMRTTVLKPVVLGGRVLNWVDVDTVEVSQIKAMLPKEETVVVAQLDTIANMGARTMDRATMMQASWDFSFIQKLGDEALQERYLAYRMKYFDGYLERKVFATALGLMEFRE